MELIVKEKVKVEVKVVMVVVEKKWFVEDLILEVCFEEVGNKIVKWLKCDGFKKKKWMLFKGFNINILLSLSG